MHNSGDSNVLLTKYSTLHMIWSEQKTFNEIIDLKRQHDIWAHVTTHFKGVINILKHFKEKRTFINSLGVVLLLSSHCY